MRRYISKLREKPESHRKRFSFLLAASFTLSIFMVWTMVNFGEGGIMARSAEEVPSANEVGPFDSLRSNLASGIDGFKQTFDEVSDTIFGNFDLDADYEEMKGNAFENYGE